MSKRLAQRIDRLLAAAFALALSNLTIKFWPDLNTFLHAHDRLIIVAAIGAPLFSLLTPIEFLTRRGRLDARAALEEKLLKALGKAATKAVEAGEGPAFVAMHIWRIRWRLGWHQRDWGRRLVRVRHLQLAYPDHYTVPFVFRKGKGAVGRAWAEGQAVAYDRAKAGAFADEESYNQARVAEPQLFNDLTFEEFNKVSNAVAIFASPIQQREKVIGCVSVDAPRGFDELMTVGMGPVVTSVCRSFTKEDLKALS